MNRAQPRFRGLRRSILVLVLLFLVSQQVAAAGGSVTWERFLSGRWLLRPLQSENFFQPYTHSATFVPARNLDGEVTAQFVPYYGVDSASSWMTTMFEQVAVTLRPITESTLHYASMLWAPLGRRRRAGDTDVTQSADPFRAHYQYPTDSCSVLPSSTGSDVIGALRNTSWTLSIFAQGSVGTATLSWEGLSGSDVESDGCNGDNQVRSREFPVTLHQQLNDYFKYRTISTTTSSSATVNEDGGRDAIPPSTIAVPLAAASESDSAHPCFRMHLGISSASIQFVDDANGIVTVLWRSSLRAEPTTSGEGSLLGQGAPSTCLAQYLLKRVTDTDEDRSVKSLTTTLVLVVVVALVKFGPRWYMRWKGVNPNSFLRRKRSETAASTNPLSGLRQQAEILQSVRKAQKA